MKSFYVYLTLLFVLAMNSYIKPQSYTTIAGPWDGNIMKIVSDFNDPATIYAAGSSVWKSVDNGTSWTKIAASSTSLFADGISNNMNLLTEDQKSTDGGNYWSPMTYPYGMSSYNGDAKINPNNPSDVFVISDDTLWRSTDFGQTWSSKDDSAGIYPFYCNKIVFSKNTNGVIYTAGGEYGYIRKSTNSGTNWLTIRYSLAYDYSSSSIAVDPSNANVVYVGRSDTLFKTTNGGSSWQHIPFPGTTISSVTFDKSNSNIVYVANNLGISKTTNAGTSWSNIYSSILNENITSLETLADGRVLIGTESQGIQISTDGAVSFNSIGGDLFSPTGMLFENNDNTIILWNYNGMYKSTNAGDTWRLTLAEGSSDRQGLSINPANSDNWVLANYYGFCSTMDGGNTWLQKPIGAADDASEIIFSKANSNYIVAETNSNLVRSTNGGLSWKLINYPITGVSASHILLSPTDPNVLFAYAQAYVNIVRSNDGGDSWVSYQNGIEIPENGSYLNDIVFDPTNASKLFTVTGGKIYSLTLPSDNWTKIYEPTASNSRYPEQLLIDPTNGMNIYSYYTTGVLNGSKDGGLTWGNATAGIPDNFKTIKSAFVGSTGKVYLSTASGIINGYPVVSSAKSEDNPVLPNYSLAQNYPNPANPSTTISFSIGKESMVSLIIYDVLGRELKKLVNEVKTAGKYSMNVNTSSWTSGVYFYSLQTDTYRDVKKFMVVK